MQSEISKPPQNQGHYFYGKKKIFKFDMLRGDNIGKRLVKCDGS